MQEEEALDFYQRVTEGTDRTQIIQLEHSSGSTLSNVEMSPVDKKTLASIVERLPDEMFESVEGAENAEEAEEELEEAGGSLSAVNEDTVGAFEDLCQKSLNHPELTKPQMDKIVSELNFETLFEIGTEIINMSVEETGSIRGFRAQE
jgi:hypothetical protein